MSTTGPCTPDADLKSAGGAEVSCVERSRLTALAAAAHHPIQAARTLVKNIGAAVNIGDRSLVDRDCLHRVSRDASYHVLLAAGALGFGIALVLATHLYALVRVLVCAEACS